MVAGRQNIRQARQIPNLLHCLVFVRELQEIEVSIRNHHVFSLAADPPAHVNVTVRASGASGVYVEADARFLFPTVSATSAGDVERNRYKIPAFQKLDSAPFLDDLSGDFMAEDQTGRSSGASAHHVLITPANIGGYDAKNNAVVDFFTVRRNEFRIVDPLHFDLSRPDVNDTTIRGHRMGSLYLKALQDLAANNPAVRP